MIKASFKDGRGRQGLLVGLSYGNLDRLREGKPIHFETSEVGGPPAVVVIMADATETAITDSLRAHGVPVLGETGDFPDGKLSPDDEGGVRMAIGVEDGVVKMVFGKPIAWLGMGIEQAESMALALLKQASILRTRQGGTKHGA